MSGQRIKDELRRHVAGNLNRVLRGCQGRCLDDDVDYGIVIGVVIGECVRLIELDRRDRRDHPARIRKGKRPRASH